MVDDSKIEAQVREVIAAIPAPANLVILANVTADALVEGGVTDMAAVDGFLAVIKSRVRGVCEERGIAIID